MGKTQFNLPVSTSHQGNHFNFKFQNKTRNIENEPQCFSHISVCKHTRHFLHQQGENTGMRYRLMCNTLVEEKTH